MIVVPYTRLLDETREAVPEARFIEIEAEQGYRELLAELWREGEEFTLVEHDVIPTRAQLAELEACSEPWCHYGYFPGHWIPVFGCCRFSARLIAGTAGVWDDPSWHWGQLDARFAQVARERGWRPHWHSPHVRHAAEFNYEGGSHRVEISPALLLELAERERSAVLASLP
jgi:hypothetical protein